MPIYNTWAFHQRLQLYLFGESQSNVFLPRADCFLFLPFLLLDNNVETRMLKRLELHHKALSMLSSVNLKLSQFSNYTNFQITEESSIEMCYCKLSLQMIHFSKSSPFACQISAGTCFSIQWCLHLEVAQDLLVFQSSEDFQSSFSSRWGSADLRRSSRSSFLRNRTFLPH